MATLIQMLDLTRFHHEESLGFHGMVYFRLKTLVDPVIIPSINRYKMSIDDFDAAVRQCRASLLTKDIKDIDYQLGNLYRGFRQTVKRMLRNLDENKSTAAHRVDFVLKKYEINGNPAALALVEQMEVFSNLLDELKAPAVMEAIHVLCAKAWVDDLDRYNKELFELYNRRIKETANYIVGRSKHCRKATEANYRTCTNYINASINTTNTGQYEMVVEEINRLINQMKTIFAARKTTGEMRLKRRTGEGFHHQQGN
ncbi:MAG: DUF6261 family protein [Candidatus Symbiothrix sp.]|jgi:hypothetical protein|nr:DUF6261 family protein [Candidatus Symbiothrix sp.]